MLKLRADPWMPEFGMGFETAIDEPPARVDPFVETEDWTGPRPPTDPVAGPVWFVDGVRRVELRLLAADGDRTAPGLFGSYAVGSVRCDGKATFEEHQVGRALVVGGGLQPSPVEVSVGGTSARYEPVPEPGSEPDRPLWRLQQLMRQAEGAMAARTAAEEDAVVLADGPLGFFDATRCPVVGVVKRFARRYLEPEHDVLLTRLAPGERTPLFGLGTEGGPVERYAWYTRLRPLEGPWHDHAGLVRCELRAGVGLDRAVEVAGTVSATLPRFAGRASDPRTPQNLAPVAGLEAWLRHRMGHAAILRRALLASILDQVREGAA